MHWLYLMCIIPVALVFYAVILAVFFTAGRDDPASDYDTTHDRLGRKT